MPLFGRTNDDEENENSKLGYLKSTSLSFFVEFFFLFQDGSVNGLSELHNSVYHPMCWVANFSSNRSDSLCHALLREETVSSGIPNYPHYWSQFGDMQGNGNSDGRGRNSPNSDGKEF